jgi:hypothetical protein
MRFLLILEDTQNQAFLKKYNLNEYLFCPEDLNKLVETPSLDYKGKIKFTKKENIKNLKLFFKILEEKMQKGDFIIIEKCRIDSDDFKRFLNLAGKFFYKVINSKDFEKLVEEKAVDFSKYQKVHHFGDIQGCYNPLKKYFEDYPIKDDELYVFVGDYCDRGKQNGEALKFVLELSKNENFIFLEGNHEFHLWEWFNNQASVYEEFEKNTRPQIEEIGITRNQVKKFYKNLKQFLLYEFAGKKVLITHGGLSTLPDAKNLLLIPAIQAIKGVGDYSNTFDINQNFLKTTENSTYQIHGHRNLENLDTRVNERCFLLEDKVEFGGSLRVIVLDQKGFHPISIKNTFEETKPTNNSMDIKSKITSVSKSMEAFSKDDFLKKLKINSNFDQKHLAPELILFKQKKENYYSKKPNLPSTSSRQIVYNIQNQEIVIRDYDKFFNYGERPETHPASLAEKLKFPLKIHIKENGFLVLVGYNSQYDELVFLSKDEIETELLNDFKADFFTRIGDSLEYIKSYLKDNQACLAFEVIDPEKNPRIIEYEDKRIILLDIIKRQADFAKENHYKVKEFSKKAGLECRKTVFVLDSWNEFQYWFEKVNKQDYTFHGLEIEGFILEDMHDYIFKIKTPYYKFWSQMKNVQEVLLENKKLRVNNFSGKNKELADSFVEFLKSLPRKELQKPFIELKREFGDGV